MEEEPKMDFIACMFHIPASEFDYIEETLKSYDIGRYLIGQELTPYEHYHIVFEGNEKIYHTFSTKLKKKYQLRGRAIKGHPRQYGKIKDIEDIEKLLAYTVKDGNFRGTFSATDIQRFVENSFKKDDIKQFRKEVMEHIEGLNDLYRKTSFDGTTFYDDRKLKLQIMKYYRDNKIEFTKSKINLIFNYMIQFSSKPNIRMTLEEIYEYLF
jgi:hypothetical protein